MKTFEEIEKQADEQYALKQMPDYDKYSMKQYTRFHDIKHSFVAGFIEGEAHIIGETKKMVVL